MTTKNDNGGRDLIAAVTGSRGARYFITTDGDGVVSCTCMAWRFMKLPIARRTCKHITETLARERRMRVTETVAAPVRLVVGLAPAPSAPVAPAPVGRTDAALTGTGVERLAGGIAAETARVPAPPREVPAWVERFAAEPSAVASRAAAEADRAARAAEFARRGRVLPPPAPRGPAKAPAAPVEPPNAGRGLWAGLELDDRVRLVETDGQAAPVDPNWKPTPEPEDEGQARFRGLELD